MILAKKHLIHRSLCVIVAMLSHPTPRPFTSHTTYLSLQRGVRDKVKPCLHEQACNHKVYSPGVFAEGSFTCGADEICKFCIPSCSHKDLLLLMGIHIDSVWLWEQLHKGSLSAYLPTTCTGNIYSLVDPEDAEGYARPGLC